MYSEQLGIKQDIIPKPLSSLTNKPAAEGAATNYVAKVQLPGFDALDTSSLKLQQKLHLELR
jgi:hypothetical protein